MNLDTTFLIDLYRDYAGKAPSGAKAFLRHHPNVRFRVSVVAVVEFLEGFEITARGDRFLEAFEQVGFTHAMAREAARMRRELREQGRMIGDLDILIAATAVHLGEPLVTANTVHFSRIPALQCAAYRNP